MKNQQLYFVVTFMGCLAIFGTSFWHATGNGSLDSSHRLALESKSTKKNLRNRNLETTSVGSREYMDLDIVVGESETTIKAARTANAIKTTGSKAGKAGYPQSKVISLIEGKLAVPTDRSVHYLFPQNYDYEAKPLNNILSLDLKSTIPGGDRVNLALMDKESGTVLVRRNAQVSHDRYIMPMMPGHYELVLKDEQGNVLTNGNGNLDIGFNQDNLIHAEDIEPESSVVVSSH